MIIIRNYYYNYDFDYYDFQKLWFGLLLWLLSWTFTFSAFSFYPKRLISPLEEIGLQQYRLKNMNMITVVFGVKRYNLINHNLINITLLTINVLI